jgi:hypothetical protein
LQLRLLDSELGRCREGHLLSVYRRRYLNGPNSWGKYRFVCKACEAGAKGGRRVLEYASEHSSRSPLGRFGVFPGYGKARGARAAKAGASRQVGGLGDLGDPRPAAGGRGARAGLSCRGQVTDARAFGACVQGFEVVGSGAVG